MLIQLSRAFRVARDRCAAAAAAARKASGSRAFLAAVLLVSLLAAGAARASAALLPGYTLLETITVPSDGSSVSSLTSLSSSVAYKLVASGTYEIGGFGADAEYIFPGPFDYFTNGGLNAGDYGIAIDDPTVGGLKLPFWGEYNETHEYIIDFTGLDSTISLNVHDDDYTDNVGSLQVQIFQAVPEPSSMALLALGGVIVTRRRR